MPKVVKFTYYHYHSRGLYTCNLPGDHSGEYVPLAEYGLMLQQRQAMMADLKGKYNRLYALIERVIEVNGRAVSGDKLYLSELTGLLADCRGALEGGEG